MPEPRSGPEEACILPEEALKEEGREARGRWGRPERMACGSDREVRGHLAEERASEQGS